MEKSQILAKKLGIRIKSLREENGFSQRLLASHIGVDERYLRKIEKGKANPSFFVLANLSIQFKLSISEMLEGI